MKYDSQYLKMFLLVLGMAFVFSPSANAQEPKTGKLKVSVALPEAHTFCR